MFRVGDRVVIRKGVGSDQARYVNNFYYDSCFAELDENKVYTIHSFIHDIDGNQTHIRLESGGYGFYKERFISLKEYRKQKIKRLCLEKEIK